MGDFPIARADGGAAYQLAAVGDDARQGVDEVHRGDDLLDSTPRQIALQRALGLPSPHWFHLPLVTDAAGQRLAKRHDALALGLLRERGVDPRALVGWVARGAGIALPAGEAATAAELLGAFDLERLPRAPVAFGPAELARLTEAAPRPSSRSTELH